MAALLLVMTWSTNDGDLPGNDANEKPGDDHSPPGWTDDQAAFRGFPTTPVFAAWLKRSSSSPARTAAIRVSMTAGSLSLDPTAMPALPFSNSMGLAPNLIDMTTCPAGSVFHQGRTACCLVVACRSPLSLVHRWTVRTWFGSFRSSFCSSSFATNLARRAWTGSLPVLGMAVNESDLRTGMWVLRCWMKPAPS